MERNLFTVEDGYNTSYIDSLLMALFYKKSTYLDSLLYNDIKLEHIYLQELIKLKFVEQVRKNISIPIEIINEIRLYAYECGWKNCLEPHTICEFYEFMCEILTIRPIQISDNTIPYITSDNEESIKKIFAKYKLTNIPNVICISINNNTQIDIQKKIKFNNMKWSLHSLICLRNDHYYSLIKNNNTWLIYDNSCVPCLYEVSIKSISDIIKSQVVFVIYCYE